MTTRPCYPSDLTDEQWAVLEPRVREVMAELTIAVGRSMVHNLRAMCDAVAYVVKRFLLLPIVTCIPAGSPGPIRAGSPAGRGSVPRTS